MEFKIKKFSSLESTNAEALLKDYPEGTVIIADVQTKGRGQRGNVWKTEPFENLTFSLVLHPDRLLTDSFHISMATAFSVVESLRNLGIQSKIKWPNDIYVQDKKIAGILIENSLNTSAMVIRKSVIGIGINVGQTVFPSDLPNPTSLRLCGCSASRELVLELFLESFSRNISMDTPLLHELYMANLWRKEGFYLYQDAKGEFMAEIVTVNPGTGKIALRRQTSNLLSEYYFKEVNAVMQK